MHVAHVAFACSNQSEGKVFTQNRKLLKKKNQNQIMCNLGQNKKWHN